MRITVLLMALILSACTATVTTPALPVDSRGQPMPPPHLSPEQAARDFVEVVSRVEPVAERQCRRRTSAANCNFQIVVDDRRSEPPNAFQSVDKSGRPIITFTVALIAEARNADELAFVMGHETAHHILNHLERQRRNAVSGAVIFAELATLSGGSAADVADAEQLGAVVGARSYSKEFELEADELGTLIAYRAGYDPLLGARFFARIPDPGNQFLGTHPPNATRFATVARTVALLQQ